MTSCKRWFTWRRWWIGVVLVLGGGDPAWALDFAQDVWPAAWISSPVAGSRTYGVFHFRKVFRLAVPPASFRVRVSGDNRYRLFVNGVSVASGPQSSDPAHWRYELVDIAPQLKSGDNVLAALVVNFGDDPPYGMMGVQTAFLLQGETPAEALVNTDASWRVARDEAYQPLPNNGVKWGVFLGVGPGDDMDGRRYPWGWEQPEFDDREWPAAKVLRQAVPASVGTDVVWGLLPRSIAMPAESPTRFRSLRRSEGMVAGAALLAGDGPLTIPPNSKIRLLLDQGGLINAFPVVRTTGGLGGHLTLTYAEALFDRNGAKGQRDDITDRQIRGFRDRFVLDGGRARVYRPLGYRTYRYVEIELETADHELVLEDVFGIATGYPFVAAGSFHSSDPAVDTIWEVGWNTARLCAYDTYMDCPYFEQMQYIGDSRIQGLISLYVADDDRLLRNALQLFDWSRIPEGLTRSRYPSMRLQVIPSYSLIWVGMVHDYWRYRNDPGFVDSLLPGVEAVLGWFERRIDRSGNLGPLPFWNFVDWAPEWRWVDDANGGGQPPGVREGKSTILAFQLVCALRDAAEIARDRGRGELAARYERLASVLRNATKRGAWDERRKLFADIPGGTEFSQHANVLAVLAGAVTGNEARNLMRAVLRDPDLVQCSVYFRFYLGQALRETGLGDDYLSQLGPWQTMIDHGLVTFAERPGHARSDCHAWSASPTVALLSTVCGVEPAGPGFKQVNIEPHLGRLQYVEAKIVHPQGMIAVRLVQGVDRLQADITLPPGLTGSLRWHGKTMALRSGVQSLQVSGAVDAADVTDVAP